MGWVLAGSAPTRSMQSAFSISSMVHSISGLRLLAEGLGAFAMTRHASPPMVSIQLLPTACFMNWQKTEEVSEGSLDDTTPVKFFPTSLSSYWRPPAPRQGASFSLPSLSLIIGDVMRLSPSASSPNRPIRQRGPSCQWVEGPRSSLGCCP